MKVLIINDRLILGGAEVQSIREKNILQQNGHDSYLLTFDESFPIESEEYNEINGFYNISILDKGIKRVYRKLFSDYFLLLKIRKIIDKIKPDIIHLNNLYLAPITQYKALKNYKVIQTIRDYSAVCPLANCILNDKTVCEGYKYRNCKTFCGNNKLDIRIRLWRTRKIERLRMNLVDKFICPSQKLTEYCRLHGYDILGINNPFDFSKITNFQKNIKFNEKLYLYFGAINENKGVFRLIEAFNEFSRDKEVKLFIAGSGSEEDINRLNRLIGNNIKIKYLGRLKYDDIMNLLQSIYCVVVPSLWMENYANTILEAMATKCLVLGSNRGGIPEMIKSNGITFDILRKESIITALECSFNIYKEEYLRIIEKAANKVINNNSIDKYYERIMKVFKNILAN